MTTPSTGGESPALPNMPGAGSTPPSGGARSYTRALGDVQGGLRSVLGMLEQIDRKIDAINTKSTGLGRAFGGLRGFMGNLGSGQSNGMRIPDSSSMPGAPATSRRSRGAPAAQFGPAGGAPDAGDGSKPSRFGRIYSAVKEGNGALVTSAVTRATFAMAGNLGEQAVSNDILGRNLAVQSGTFRGTSSNQRTVMNLNAAFGGAFTSSGERNAMGTMGLNAGFTMPQLQSLNRGLVSGANADPMAGGTGLMQQQVALDQPGLVNMLRRYGVNTRSGALSDPRSAAEVYSQLFDRMRGTAGNQSMTGAEFSSSMRQVGMASLQGMGFSQDMIQTFMRVNGARVQAAGPNGAAAGAALPGLDSKAVQSVLGSTAYRDAARRAQSSGSIDAGMTSGVVMGLNALNDTMGKLDDTISKLTDHIGGAAGFLPGALAGTGNALPGMAGASALSGVGSAVGSTLSSYLSTKAALAARDKVSTSVSKGGGLFGKIRGLFGGGGAAEAAGVAEAGTVAADAGAAAAGAGGIADMGLTVAELLPLLALNSGGSVPGRGMGDSVRARLTPGEVVVPRHTVAKHGGPQHLMRKLGFGGRDDHHRGPGYADGGSVWGRPDDASLEGMYSSHGQSFQVNKAAGPRFVDFLNALWDSGYHFKSVGGFRTTQGGGMSATDPPSNHRFGAAIDVDADLNPFYYNASGGRHAINDGVARTLASRYGLYWGGDYKSRKDFMHFEVLGAPATPGGGSPPALPPTSGAGGTGSSNANPSSGPGGTGAGAGSILGSLLTGSATAAALASIVNQGNALDPSSGGAGGTGASTPTSANAPAPGGRVAGNVATWIKSALSILGMDYGRFGPGISNMIQNESSGDPHAQNNSDSNAAAGHPSKGLMQVIDTTFSQYSLAGHKDIWNPVDNIIAGVRYAESRYGDSMLARGGNTSGGRYAGYSEGAWRTHAETANLHEGEMILPSRIAQAVRSAMTEGGAPRGGGGGGRPVVINVNVASASEAEARRMADMVKRMLDDESYLEKVSR